MGRIIANKVKGMNWMAKVSLILVFTLIFSTFMQQGLFNPKEASAAIADVSAGAGARVNGWYRVTGGAGPFTITNANFSCGAGTNRLLVVAVTGETGAAAVPGVTVVKPAGTARTLAVQTTASTRTLAFIGYFTEAQIVSSGTNSIVVTNATATPWTGSDVYLACFSGIDPITPIVVGGTAQLGSDVTTTTSWPFSVTTASGSVVMYTGGLATAGTGVFTNPAGFTESYDITGTGYATTLASNAAPANPEAKSVTYATGNRYAFAAATLNPYVVADVTAPTVGTVNVTPTSGIYTTAAPVITATLTDAESTVTACQYYTDGATWVAGVVSGSSPTWTCTGSPTGLTGARTINVRGTSTGGTGTGSSVARTVDATAPTDGVLTVTPGDLQNTIDWTAATDGGSGLAASPYVLRFAIGATAPANCTLGTAVTGSPFASGTLSTTHTGLVNGTQYSYRLCAVDALSNTSAGATGSGTPAPDPSKITSCGDCHGNPPVDSATRDGVTGRFPGSHNKHSGSGAGQYSFVCTNCHRSPLWTTYSHRDGNVQFTTMFGGVAGGSYSRANAGNWFTQVNTVAPGTCANTYCHSKGTGGTLNPGETRPVAANTSPTWGSVVTCATCHGNETGNPGNGAPWYTTQTTKANSHQAHAGAGTPCFKCHYATTNTGSTITSVGRHNNRTYDIVTAPGISIGSYTYSTTGGACATISCHGNGNMKWGTGSADCIGCHAVAFPKALGGMGTIRNVTGAGGDFTRASRHLYNAPYTTIKKWDCIVCHMEGNEADANGKTNSTYHNEGAGATGGRVNVRNVDAPATGWVINNRAWTTTDYTNLDTFCLTCHDADGAAGINVNAANNGLNLAATRALTPFNTANYPGGVVGASTWSSNAGPRTRVVNIKDKFFAGNAAWPSYNGNPSQHAVIGQRYSTVNANWTAAAWASYVGKKMGQNLNVRRETSLLSCADCHVLDAGSGAHGGTNAYNMWTTGVSTFCYRCHNSTVYNWTGSAAGSRITHSGLDGNASDPVTAYGLPNGTDANCLLCHASWNEATTVTRNASYGGIHGSWNTTASWYTTAGARTAYRFAPGAEMKMSPPSDTAWSSVAMLSCYFGTETTQQFSSCNQHSNQGGTEINYNYGRPPKY